MLELPGLVEIVQTLEESTAETLERCGVAWERLEREEAERRYPIRVPEGSFAVVQPEAGIARADKALAAFARELDVREHTRAHPDEVDADVGRRDRRLVGERAPRRAAAGEDDPRDALLLPARRRVGRSRRSSRSSPSEHTHEMYSLHDPVYGLKVGAHHAGQEADPNVPGEPEPHLIERIAAWAHETYRLDDPTPVGAETCMYTTTADEAFILERRGRIVIGSPCSGHGFKFAPAIGERLAELAALEASRLTILRACPRTSSEATSRASGTSSSATTGRS